MRGLKGASDLSTVIIGTVPNPRWRKDQDYYSWNEDQVPPSRYIDDHHVEVGDNPITSVSLQSAWNKTVTPMSLCGDNLPEQCYSLPPVMM